MTQKRFTPAEAAKLIEELLSNKSADTRRAYLGDLADFASRLKSDSAAEAVHELLSMGRPEANAVVEKYKRHMADRRWLAVSSIRRRLAALRSLVTLARRKELVSWKLDVDDLVVRSKEATRSRAPRKKRKLEGPSLDVVSQMRESLQSDARLKAIRDRAILDLAADLGLRRGELALLDVSDVDKASLRVLGKGREESEELELPAQTAESLQKWITVRPGPKVGALFPGLNKVGEINSDRMSTTSIYKIIRSLGDDVGAHVRPHGLRHTAITEAIEYAARTGVSLEEVRHYSRHANIGTLLRYRDKRNNRQGMLAKGVADKSRNT